MAAVTLTGCGGSAVARQTSANVSVSTPSMAMEPPTSFTCPDVARHLSSVLNKKVAPPPGTSDRLVCRFDVTGIPTTLVFTTAGALSNQEARVNISRRYGTLVQIEDLPRVAPGAFAWMLKDRTKAELLVPYSSGLWVFELKPATQVADPVGTLIPMAQIAFRHW